MAITQPSIAVIMPLLNESAYVREALDSLLLQRYEALEIIVYDGGSTDGTLDILRDYPVEVHFEPGLGQMAAINRGWERTTAEFVTWMAGDDRLRPGTLQRLSQSLQASPAAAVVHADAAIIDGQGRLVGLLQPGNVQLRELIFEFTLVPQTALIRRAALKRSGMFDARQRLAADHDIFLRLAQYFPFQYVGFTAADYRIHAGSQDAQDRPAVAQAVIQVVSQFFMRPDLTPEQLSWRKRGMAGAYLFAGAAYCLVGDKHSAWPLLRQAFTMSPTAVLATRRGLGVVARLLSPVAIGPYRLRTWWQRLMRSEA
jgi:glycosyltransferase involved in cell wall biosynthesis